MCKISCSEPGSLLACDPEDTRCCEVCPCCDGCYSGTKPDKCLGDDLTNCVCNPISCCATHSCNTKDKDKEQKEKDKPKNDNDIDIDQVKEKMEKVENAIDEANKELNGQIEELQLYMAADIIEDNTSAEGVCKDEWTHTTGNNVNCVGGNLCYDPDECKMDCFEPTPLACDDKDRKCCDACPCCKNCPDFKSLKCAETEIMYCLCYPPECCATFSCKEMWSHNNLRGDFGGWR